MTAALLRPEARHPGQWELQTYRDDPAARAFWSRTLSGPGLAAQEETPRDNRLIHRFRVPEAAA